MLTRASKYNSVTIRIRKGSCNGKEKSDTNGLKDTLGSSNNHPRRDLLLDGLFEKHSRMMSHCEII